MNVLEKLLILSGTLWLSALAFIVYTWIMQVRQQAVLRYIAYRLAGIDKSLKGLTPAVKLPRASVEPTAEKPSAPTPETVIAIDKNEPLSKYETVSLPDEADINFVDR